MLRLTRSMTECGIFPMWCVRSSTAHVYEQPTEPFVILRAAATLVILRAATTLVILREVAGSDVGSIW